MNLRQLLNEIYNNYSATTAIAYKNESLSYFSLRKRIDSISSFFVNHGCQPEDTVVYLGGSALAYCEIMLACFQTGLTFCPLEFWAKEQNLSHVISELKPQYIIGDCTKQELWQNELEDLLPRCRMIVWPKANRSSSRILSYSSLTASHMVLCSNEIPEDTVILKELKTLNNEFDTFTYGDIAGYIVFCQQELARTAENVLICTPYVNYTSVQEILLALASGSTIFFLDQFTPKDFIKIVEWNHITSTFLTPFLVTALAMDRRFLNGNLQSLLHVRIGPAYFDRLCEKKLKEIVPTCCSIEKISGFPRPYCYLHMTAAELDQPRQNCIFSRLNSIGTPLPECSVITASARASVRKPAELFWTHNRQNYWNSTGHNGWIEPDGTVYYSWEAHCAFSASEVPFPQFHLIQNYEVFCHRANNPTFEDVYTKLTEVHGEMPTETFKHQLCQIISELLDSRTTSLVVFDKTIRAEDIRHSIQEQLCSTLPQLTLPSFWYIRDKGIFPFDELTIHKTQGEILNLCPIYSRDMLLVGCLYFSTLATAPRTEISGILSSVVRTLPFLICTHRDFKALMTECELYRCALNLSDHAVSISGLENKSMLIFANSKASELINLGRRNPTFGALLEESQTANLSDIRQDATYSSSHSFFYNNLENQRIWINYRAEKVDIMGNQYAITFGNTQDTDYSTHHLTNLLSPREVEISQHMLRGLTNIEIAEETGITVNTVKYHISNMYKKMQVSNRTELLGSIFLKSE